MDLYCEQSLNNPNIDKHARRAQVLNIVRYVMLFLVGVIIMACLLLPGVDPDNVALTIIYNLILMVCLCIPLILGYIFLGKYISASSQEYDYILSGNSFKIIKIINRKKRKLFLNTTIDCFQSLGSVNSEAYDRYAVSKDIKMSYALTDMKNTKNVFYIYYIAEGEKNLLHFAPTHEMMIAIRKSIGSITVFDKSFKYDDSQDEQG